MDITEVTANGGVAYAGPFYSTPSANLKKWNAAIGRVLSGAGRATLVMGGDSLTVGAGAGTGTVGVDGARLKSVTEYTARQLAARGIPTNTQCFVGHKNLADIAAVEAYFPVTHGAGWSISGAANGFAQFLCPSPGVGEQAWTFADPIDTVTIISTNASGFGTFTVTADADPTVLATVNSNAATGFQRTTITLPLGAHVIKIRRTTGGDIRTLGVIGYNSAVPAVDVINLGGYGTNSAGWNNTGSLSLGGLQAALAPDLFALNIGTNDKIGAVAQATTEANLNAIAATVKAVCDVALIVPTPISSDTVQRLAEYTAMFKRTGLTNGCMVYDESERFVSYATAFANGLMYDVTHLNKIGYASLGIGLARALIN